MKFLIKLLAFLWCFTIGILFVPFDNQSCRVGDSFTDKTGTAYTCVQHTVWIKTATK
ncbi:MAG: hypothetical protein M3367_03140 [Acidobacteriota bacterium]|nr:hypothetical protein [Acidobacteriota bacterium]